jgi:hypothetical protein
MKTSAHRPPIFSPSAIIEQPKLKTITRFLTPAIFEDLHPLNFNHWHKTTDQL